MRIKALLVTHDIPEESIPWMAEVRNIFDELVIFIDEKRVTPGTVNRAREVGSRVHYHKAETWFDWDLAAKARACESDWVFTIERDEQLSPEWRQSQWRQILAGTQLTHFWVPRRWVVPGDRYITAAPWWPDSHPRLVRTDVSGASFPTRLHDFACIPGPGGYLQTLAIHHHVLWLYSRALREERVRYYEQLRPGGGLGYYYLYEDYAPPEAPLPKPVQVEVDREILRMEKLPPKEASKVSFEVNVVPGVVHVSALFSLDAKVVSGANETLSSAIPYPISLSYHWMEKTNRRMIVFDGSRSALFPALEANATAHYPMAIIAPDQPGDYILQTTMVQDGVGWFENIRPGIVREFDVSVIAL